MKRRARAAPAPDAAACGPPDRRVWTQPRRAVSRPYSHSIINEPRKLLICNVPASASQIFTVICYCRDSLFRPEFYR